MNFLKRLLHKADSRIPAARSLDGEIHRLDAIDAISPRPRKEAHWRTLHPLVQAHLVHHVGEEDQMKLPISTIDAASVFHYWGYPVNRYTLRKTSRQEELMQQYAASKERLWQQLKDAQQRFQQIDAAIEREQEQAWQAYWEHYETLPRHLQHLVTWELAKRGMSQGRSGFHAAWKGQLPFPFAVCGWASYQDPEWGPTEGVAFRVTKDCFGDRKPLLYYLDDDHWPQEDHEAINLAIIQEYSSGVSGVRVEQCRCKGWDDVETEQRVVLFELDPAAIRPTVQLSGEAVSTNEVGEYIFVLPRCGEFYCVLGEVRDGEMIPLHKDDFCMK